MTEERFRPDSLSPFAPVNLAILEHRGQPTDERRVEILDEKTGEWKALPGVSSVHSRDYRLVPNKDIYDLGENVLAKTGVPWRPLNGESAIAWNGKQFVSRWATEAGLIKGPDGALMHLGFEVRNSYDGSSFAGFAFFALRIICQNQFHSRNVFGDSYDFPHIFGRRSDANDIVIAQESILRKLDTFAGALPVFDKLQNKLVGSFDDFLKLRTELSAATKVPVRDSQLFDELSGQGVLAERQLNNGYTRPLTHWGLLNAYAAITTHAVGNVRGSEQGRAIADWFIARAA